MESYLFDTNVDYLLHIFLILAVMKEQQAALALLKGRKGSTHSNADSGIAQVSDSTSPTPSEKKEIANYPTSEYLYHFSVFWFFFSLFCLF